MIIVPSYKRPEKLKSCLDSILQHSVCSDVYVVLNINDESSYSNLMDCYDPKGINFIVSEASNCPEKLNVACDVFGGTYENVSFIGDDCVVTSPAWDAMCIDHIQQNFNGLGVVSPSEPEWGRNYDDLPLHWVQSTSFWKTVGYYVHREMKHCYVDNLIRDFAKSINSYAKLSNCVIEHHHPNHGFENDEVYDMGEKKHCEDDKAVYFDYINSPEYFKIIKRLQEKKNVQ